ncbi:MAG: excinuclease ABC subunit UvrA, partial [Candidatus Lindowbacteria bacterium]|nr:excinuclease ABC subunit UvrA [Candidatus Lindowbacteria bacterium]
MSSTGKPIVIKGARVHNLKNINVEIPQNTITVITGLSGSGKSSLAFDTIYAEGQRRYVESLSTYARQFLGQMDKADVDSIEGLSPAIAIEQKTTQRNPRSTVGTVTEIYDHLRLLWARIGTPHCPKCKKVVHAMPPEKIVDAVLLGSKNEKIKVLAPLASAKKGTFKKEIAALKKDGFLKAKIDGEFVGLDDIEELPKTVRHDIDVVVDRIAVKNANRSRIHEAIELGLKTANGLIVIENDKGDRQLFSEHSACPDCGIGIEPLDPKHFSFNSPHGACHDCLGLGVHFDVDPGKVIGDKKLSILKGCIVPWGENPQKKWFGRRLWKLKGDVGIDLDVPWKELTEQTKKLILFGRAASKTATENSHWERRRRPFEGVVANLQRRYKETNSSVVREWIEQYMTLRECPVCDGERIKETSRVVTVSSKNGDDEYRLPELLKLTIEDIGHWLNKINLDATKRKIGERLIEEIQSRLGFLEEVGLEYLTLERNAATLSGGEAQRIRLATQLGS